MPVWLDKLSLRINGWVLGLVPVSVTLIIDMLLVFNKECLDIQAITESIFTVIVYRKSVMLWS